MVVAAATSTSTASSTFLVKTTLSERFLRQLLELVPGLTEFVCMMPDMLQRKSNTFFIRNLESSKITMYLNLIVKTK